MGVLTWLGNQRFRLNDGFENVLGPFGLLSGAFCLGGGALDRPNRASRLALELSWASFARFLLPTMAWGASISVAVAVVVLVIVSLFRPKDLS